MKKIIIWLLAFIPAIVSYAGDGDKHISVNAGILAPYTLDATIGYEHPIGYGHAFEVYAEAGNHWQTPVCHRFWKGYFWDGGIIYKHRISRFKNGRLRAVGGLQCGLDRQKIFFGVEPPWNVEPRNDDSRCFKKIFFPQAQISTLALPSTGVSS